MITRDLLWKGIIEDLFEDFLQFFFPDAVDLFDLEKGYEFLEQELQQLYPESEVSARYADKLVKVYLKEGGDIWVLIHVEVQGQAVSNFPDRMFTYFYRALDRYNKKIAAIAILTDDQKGFSSDGYEYQFLDTRLSYHYRKYKLLEHPLESIRDKENPFAIVLEAAWQALVQNKGKDELLLNHKISLIRKLLNTGYAKQKVKRIFRFIEHYVHFEKPEFFTKFDDQVKQIRKKMGIEELIRQAMIEDIKVEVREEVIQEVREEVIQEVREEVIQEVREEVIQEVREEVIQEVREEVLRENNKIHAKRMLSKGFSIEDVSSILDIPSASVEQWAKESL